MPYRVGIFDPAFTKEGHFVAFDRYVAELLNDSRYQVVFLDLDGYMRETYEGRLFLGNTPEFQALLPETASGKIPLLPSRLANILNRVMRWKRSLRTIASLNLDLVLITSESYDPLMYLFRPKFRYGLFILNPRLYIYLPKTAATWLHALANRFYARCYKDLVDRASFLLTTNEPPMIAGLEDALKRRDLPWLPNLDLKPLGEQERKSSPMFDFLTIGTISRSKSHTLALNAYKENGLDYRYLVAGLPRDSVGRSVEALVHELENDESLHVRGEFGYITEERYSELMLQTRYALLPYDFARGNISSQVMHDCFQRNIPIVAPNIEPFAWYVEKYGIGFLYKEGDAVSLADTLKRAMETDPGYFAEGFARLQQDHTLEVIKKGFLPLVEKALQR